MAMNLMLPLTTLINRSELKQRPYIGAVVGEGDEDGDIGGVILRRNRSKSPNVCVTEREIVDDIWCKGSDHGGARCLFDI
ncbi:unnamed protein product [Lupinus luteus]|uniref:Uncharacterized protein n=1 Tax=Lupinus luteus TaxID=3873 RepID=A0AAV1VQM8_LUPLU